MSDICNLVAATTMALCQSPAVCRDTTDGALHVCASWTTPCQSLAGVYECRDPSGKRYFLGQDEVDNHDKGK